MKNISFYTFFISHLFLLGCTSSRVTENRALIKEYAYCKCLQFALKDSVLFKKDLSISIYREIAHYYEDAYDIVDSFSKKAAAGIMPSIIADHNGEKAVFKDCFLFYKSKELDSLIKKLNKRMYHFW